MTKKEAFIKIIQKEIFDRADIYEENYPDDYELARAFWNDFKNGKMSNSNEVTENGQKILAWMQDNLKNQSVNLATSKAIAEALFTSGRSIAGSMRKLINDEYVEKVGKDPVRYSLTIKGQNFKP